jgi:hypothetical protein
MAHDTINLILLFQGSICSSDKDRYERCFGSSLSFVMRLRGLSAQLYVTFAPLVVFIDSTPVYMYGKVNVEPITFTRKGGLSIRLVQE